MAFGSGRTTAGVIAKVDAIPLEMPSTAEPADQRDEVDGIPLDG